jgi:hypothetical protein
VIEVIPSDIVARRYQAGADSEALERLSQPSRPDDAPPDSGGSAQRRRKESPP